jgi:aldehyde dehydrogenase (NAD+)
MWFSFVQQERAERLARGIAAGMSNINDFACSYLCQSLPFGGVKVR